MANKIKRAAAFILICILAGCTQKAFRPNWTNEQAPETFVARFETSKGEFDIEFTRSWSPMAADRVYQLLRHKFFDNVLFYRVAPNFVVQFGNTDTILTNQWEKFKVPDESVIKSNVRGAVSFARSGPDTRGSHLFINTKDNKRLDTINYNKVVGFPVLGTVTRGMDVVESMYAGYGNKTMEVYDSLSADRARYQAMFPKLDSIRKAYILKRN
jgi:peptidyl-prolyl cis-trans isomerase A (cyclophilin A)